MSRPDVDAFAMHNTLSMPSLALSTCNLRFHCKEDFARSFTASIESHLGQCGLFLKEAECKAAADSVLRLPKSSRYECFKLEERPVVRVHRAGRRCLVLQNEAVGKTVCQRDWNNFNMAHAPNALILHCCQRPADIV